MSYLVTGAGGFIGRYLCSALQSNTRTVTAALRQKANGPWDHAIPLDLEGTALSSSEIQDISCVFHLAGKVHALGESREDEREYFRINTDGTRKLLESSMAAGVRRFVYISSVKAMGEGGDVCQDESEACRPETSYGRSKLAAERLVLEGDYVPEPVVLRLSMVYGSSRKGNLPRMIGAVAKGRFPPLPEVGNQRSMVHVEDVVQAIVLAAEKQAAVGQTYIVTDGQACSTRQMYELVCEALDKPVPAWTIPIGMLKVLAKVGDGIGGVRGRQFMFDSGALDKLISSACYSSEKIQRELGFRPAWDLRSALSEIVISLGMKRAGDQATSRLC